MVRVVVNMRRSAAALLALAALAAGWAAASEGHVQARRPGVSRAGEAAAGRRAPFASGLPHGRAGGHSGRPNIVFVLTDDLSMDLLRFMPQVQALQARGMNFANYFVSDSLCCPSRSSIFTGNFPHDTGVFTNTGVDGGIGAFFAHGNEQHTFNLALAQAGYRTAMMGKYLNGYMEGPARSPVPSTYVPPGWSEWDVAGWGYPEYNYELNQNGSLHHYGHRPQDYLTSVLARRGISFINRSARSGQPFFLELATFAPHSPYTPPPGEVKTFPGLRAPRPPSFDVLPTGAPSWLADHPPLRPGQLRRIDSAFRRRVQAVQGVDAMLGKLEAALAAHGLTDNTYVVFSSDNGLHTGEYRLMPGKLTAFDTDIRVPLVIAGPRIPADATTAAMAENVDLAKTFSAIGGTSLPSDGHSLVDLLHGAQPADWRNAVLIEHHGSAPTTANPDAQTRLSGNPPSYSAIRTPRYLYVEYDNGEREFYDLQNDPDELHNLAAGLDPQRLAQLHEQLADLRDCHTGPACWGAGHVASGG